MILSSYSFILFLDCIKHVLGMHCLLAPIFLITFTLRFCSVRLHNWKDAKLFAHQTIALLKHLWPAFCISIDLLTYSSMISIFVYFQLAKPCVFKDWVDFAPFIFWLVFKLLLLLNKVRLASLYVMMHQFAVVNFRLILFVSHKLVIY